MNDPNQQGTSSGRIALLTIAGCGCVILLLAAIAIPFAVGPELYSRISNSIQGVFLESTSRATSNAAPTYTQMPDTSDRQYLSDFEAPSLVGFYDAFGPGVVNIRVFTNQGGVIGEGAGSGFVLDEAGHIITNNHVVDGAASISVIFYNGYEVSAETVGTDPYSDLAVIQADYLPEGVMPLALGDSDSVEVGEWVVAIGNPFGQQSSMTIGIVSAVGRTISSGATPFSIPQAIQTDAAINPGNSGGPLLNIEGQVVGVNAQIATGGISANAGVGFSIPSNIVRLVAPSLIENQEYTWPWIGVTGTDVSLMLREANNIQAQLGAYILNVDPEGPAADAGLQGITGTQLIDAIEVPIGGDVVIAVDGEPVNSFSDLLVDVAYKHPGDEVELTVLRDGAELEINVVLAPRP
jgi:S1-C subfamily serine protease